MTINEKLATIQTKFKSKKSRFNSFGKYYFRSAEDILEATKPYLLELGVSVTINEELIASDPMPILQTSATVSDGKSNIVATALVGVDLAQKGMQVPQKFGAASSYGKKYALGNLFLIDDTQDADANNSHGKSPVVDKLKQKAKPAITDDQMKDAVKYIKAGGNVEAISKKYKLNANQVRELNGQKANTKKTS